MMTFVFPDPDTLRLALTTGVVPPAVALAPARAGTDAEGRPWVRPTGPVPPKVADRLQRLGVQATADDPGDRGPTAVPATAARLDRARRRPVPRRLRSARIRPALRPRRLARDAACGQAHRAAPARSRHVRRAARHLGAPGSRRQPTRRISA